MCFCSCAFVLVPLFACFGSCVLVLVSFSALVVCSLLSTCSRRFFILFILFILSGSLQWLWFTAHSSPSPARRCERPRDAPPNEASPFVIHFKKGALWSLRIVGSRPWRLGGEELVRPFSACSASFAMQSRPSAVVRIRRGGESPTRITKLQTPVDDDRHRL